MCGFGIWSTFCISPHNNTFSSQTVRFISIMRRTQILLRGSKGYSWYGHFKQHGTEGFRKNAPPTPFNWENAEIVRPKAFFDLTIGNDKLGRVVFELASDIVPKTVENFQLLCTGKGKSGKCYKGTKFHFVNKGLFTMGGDVEALDGSSSHSAHSARYIKDENYIIPHSRQGLIRLVVFVVHQNRF